MDNSSSSESGMDDASMDDSEQEHEYEYELEEPHHEDYEGIPDEDFEDVPEDDDDDDVDDDEDDHPLDITNITSVVGELRMFSSRDYRRLPNGFHIARFENRGSPSDDEFFRDMFRETIESIQRANSRIQEQIRSMRPGELRTVEPLLLSTRVRHSREPIALHPALQRPFLPTPEPDRPQSVQRGPLRMSFERPHDDRPQNDPITALTNLQRVCAQVHGQSQEPQSDILSRLNSQSLSTLQEVDLVRSVTASPNMDLFSHYPRNRPFERLSQRERDREKISSALARRWCYEPQSTGGDSLPIMFDGDSAPRRQPRSLSRQPLVANETHESVTELANKITERIDELMTDLFKIDDEVETMQKNLEKQQKAAEKKEATEKEEKEKENDEEKEKEEEPASTDFTAVAARRAAAAGISLDAPANNNPEVVRAATESTGIDPEFLAALPEDMRTEILTQYLERICTSTEAQAGQSTSQSTTTVNQDFLMALPPELRAEVLQLDAEFQSRQEAANGSGSGGSGNENNNGARAPAEMDNASFLATLAPELREQILLESGEAFIQSLPPNMAAEARILRERDMSSRLPWRVNRQDLSALGFDQRGFPSRLRDGPGRRGLRSHPREPPIYRWKKVEDAFLRQGPDTDHEPTATLLKNGLSSLVQLVWLRHGQYEKNLVYQVLSHACKTTESRLLVLDLLIDLTTSAPSEAGPSSLASSSKHDIDRPRQHGVAVRRGLELLIMLCKNDSVIAETLLGLPRTKEELKEYESVTLTDSGESEEQKARRISLSTLISLLDSSLFARSNSHLEQLISLISTVCQSIPSNKYNSSEKQNERRSRRGGRRMPPISHQFGEDPMNFFVVDADDEEQSMYDVQEDDGDDEEESDDDIFGSLRRVREAGFNALGESGGEANEGSRANDTKSKDQEAEKDVPIPDRFRIPKLRNPELIALSKVLLRSGCSERTYDKTSRTIGLLGELQSNRTVILYSLVTIATDTSQDIQVEYRNCVASLRESESPNAKRTRAEVISAFSVASASNELTMLRVVKSLSTLLKHETRQLSNKKGEDDNDKKTMVAVNSHFQTSLMLGLQELWRALDTLLELVSEEAKMKDKKGSDKKSGIQSAAEVLKADRKRGGASRGLSPILARLSHMIEAFIVTHSIEEVRSSKSAEKATGESPTSPKMATESPSSPPSPSIALSPKSPRTRELEEEAARSMDGKLAMFVERHRGPINALLRANPGLLETSFKGALRHPHAIDFDNKKAYFRNVIRRRSSEAHAGPIRIKVCRDRVFNDSYRQLRLKTPDEMKGRLHVQFTGEEGVDAGGVTREWYIILVRQIFDPNYALFTKSAAKAVTYQPDKRSYINREHLENFHFVGRIIGKAIYDGQLLDAYFTRSFYKHILGLKPAYHDIEAQDPEYYKSLKWMLENDCTGIIDYTMSAEYEEFGKKTIIDLVPNGRNIPVTEENKAEYVRLVTDVRMTKTIEKQIEAFKRGFHELIPHEDCKIFNELELELLMSGLPDIDMADMKANVEYTGYTASSPQINWFWRCVSKMDQEDLARLVMFVTGSSKMPLEGFSHLQGMNGIQKFQIHRVAGNTMRLPSAHTCFNQLDLPEYSSAEVLAERLLRAVRDCSVGFGFA